MPTDTRVFEFADFRIDAGERVLYRREAPVRLAPKVFDTLLALASRPGRVVSKDTLMAEIWQNTFVEENNLTQHIFTLRRVLGETKDGSKFIETVPRLGYRFLPQVKIGDAMEDAKRTDATEEGLRGASSDGRSQTTPSETPSLSEDSDGSHADSQPNGVAVADQSRNSGTATIPADRVKRPVGRAILVVGLAVVTLIGSLGFALRSSWQSTTSRKMSLIRLTQSGNAWSSAISPDGKSLAYVVRDGTTYSLRLKNVQTESEMMVVPPANARLGNPRFSPDGNFIYLSRENEVLQMPVFGGGARTLASNLWTNFSVSPDGTQIAFTRDATPGGSSSILVANTDGSGERVVATTATPDFYVGWGPAPVFSPDGERLTAVVGTRGTDKVRIVEIDYQTGDQRVLEMEAVWEAIEYVDWRTTNELLVAGKKKGEDAAQIWSVRFPGGSVDRVTSDFNNYLNFTLSADKNEIVATQESENLHLWRFDSETGAVRQITSGVSRAEGRYGLAFAPDGQIVFTARDKNGYDIYSVGADGGESRQLTKNAGRNFDPVVSPDNQFIAFVSDRSGPWRLWLMNRDGTGARRLTAEPGDEKEVDENAPYFSGDGRWIFYVSQRLGKSTIRRVSIDGDESEAVGSGDETADKPVPSPDGEFLAKGIYRNGAASPWMVAVQSLGDENAPERSFDFPAFRLRVRWTTDSKSLVSVDDRTGDYNLWSTNLTNGERLPITNFKTDKIYRFDVSPDGRSYVLARGDYFYDAVLISR